MQSDYTLRIDGAPWRGWTEMEVARSIERMGAEGSVALIDRPDAPFLGGALKPGARCIVEIGADTVLDGYIDAIEQRFGADGSLTRLRFRDRTGDLVDCAASVDGPFEFSGARLEEVLARVLTPYGISVRFETDTGAPFARLALQPGETAHEFVERACRYRAVLPLSDGIGGLVVARPGGTRAAGALVYGENLLEGSAALDHGGRYSLYVVKGQAEGLDESTAEETSSAEGRAADPGVTRHRPTVIVAENQGFDLTLTARAQWEARFARARASRARYVVQGWHADGSGALWQPNTLVRVTDAPRGLNRDMLIVGVAFSRDARGTRTELDLALPEAFDLLPSRDDLDAGDPWGLA